ncbi:MAG: hypothetical protein VYC71_14950, partial [Planctomycetota bacterium]|nr:hypothetical protein [Planctomycetota bacterium]
KSGTNSTRYELPEWNRKRCGKEIRCKVAQRSPRRSQVKVKSHRNPDSETPANKKRGEQHSPRLKFRLMGLRPSSAILTSSVMAIDVGGPFFL